MMGWDRKQAAVSWGQCPGIHNTGGDTKPSLWVCNMKAKFKVCERPCVTGLAGVTAGPVHLYP